MQIPPRKYLAIGILAFVLAIAIAVFAWISFPFEKPEAAMLLPAEETIVFISNISAETIAPFAEAFPLLQSVPLNSTPSSVALVEYDGGLMWVMITPSQSPESPFIIRTSDELVTTLLSNVQSPLGKDRTYRLLMSQASDTSPAAFVRFPDISLNGGSFLGSLMQLNSPASIAATPDGLRVRFIDSSLNTVSTLAQAPSQIFENPLLILHASNLSAFLSSLNAILQPEPGVVVESVLKNAVSSLFGSSLSAAYDLAPLLKGTTTLHIARDPASQKLLMLLEGEINGNSETLARLPDLFRSKLATITQETRTFDEKFTIRNTRQDLSVVKDTKASEMGWDIRSVEQTETKEAFLLATRGGRFIIGNDDASFQTALSEPATMLPATEQSAAMLGLMKSSEIHSLLLEKVPTVWRNQAIPAGTGGYLQWKLTREGQRVTILLKKI